MTNLIDYLMGKVIRKKRGKKLIRRKRIRYGERMGKVAKDNNNKKDSKIEKLLDILIARSAPINSIEIARQKQIESDYQLAQDLSEKEQIKKKSKVVEEEEIQSPLKSEIPSTPITGVDRQHRFQAYQEEFNSIEEGYNGLIENLNENIGDETAVISRDAMGEFIARKEQLNANRNVLRKDLLEDIKNNPSEVWEWRGFIEQSENETAHLLDLDNKTSSILYDQAMRNLSERESLTDKQLAIAQENAQLMETQLKQNQAQQEQEKEFTLQLQKQNEKIKEQKSKLKKEATKKELAIKELDETQKFLSENITKNFNSGEAVLRDYLAGKKDESGKEMSGGSNKFQRAIGQTGLNKTWDEYGKSGTEEKKYRLKIALDKKVEEQQKFLPKKVESFMGALPPGSVLLQQESITESLSPKKREQSENSNDDD